MSHPVTIFTGRWADLPLAELAPKIASFGYDGLELACWGDHMDVFKAATDKKYCKAQLKVLEKSGLKCWAISNHLAGQLVCDPNNDSRSDGFGMVPKKCNGKPEAKREWAVESMKASAKAAKNLGISVVNGFTGSSIWHMLYSFPPVSDKMVDDGFKYFAKMWNPILDEFDKYGIKFALEVHPTQIAFDVYTAKKALEAIDYRPTFGFNFDPSHLLWQGMDPARSSSASSRTASTTSTSKTRRLRSTARRASFPAISTSASRTAAGTSAARATAASISRRSSAN